jgi:hypothetical protein
MGVVMWVWIQTPASAVQLHGLYHARRTVWCVHREPCNCVDCSAVVLSFLTMTE